MTDFITTIVTPGAPIFTEAELQEQVGCVQRARRVLDDLPDKGFAPSGALQGVLTAVMVQENRLAAMLLHNRLCALERWLLEEGI